MRHRSVWFGRHLINPRNGHSQLADLDAYAKLRAYYRNIGPRSVAGKQLTRWYRAIDKVDHTLTTRPKLLCPDMKLTIQPVLDGRSWYPHHTLYYVVSNAWDLGALGGLPLSRVMQAFIEVCAVKIRGGTPRFQAQYLRCIRIPRPEFHPKGPRCPTPHQTQPVRSARAPYLQEDELLKRWSPSLRSVRL